MAMDMGGKIENSKEQLQECSSERLIDILESDLQGSCNKKWAVEILTVRLTRSAIEAKNNAFHEG